MWASGANHREFRKNGDGVVHRPRTLSPRPGRACGRATIALTAVGGTPGGDVGNVTEPLVDVGTFVNSSFCVTTSNWNFARVRPPAAACTANRAPSWDGPVTRAG